MTPAARALAHVEYLTAFLTFGAAVGFEVGAGVGVEVGAGVGVVVGVVVGATRVMGLIPAVIAYVGSEKAVMEVMLHWATREVSALASAVSTVNE